MNFDVLIGWASLILTLLVFSYVLTDNFLYRIAVHILVGATAGYVAIVSIESVVRPWIEATVLNNDEHIGLRVVGAMPLLLTVGLLLKQSPRLSYLGNPFLAVIIGVGTGIAVVGAVAGTIVPLVQDTADAFETDSLFNALVLVLGTIGTLVYFQYLARRSSDGTMTRSLPMRLLAAIGQGVLMLTLGALYGGLIITSLSVLSGIFETQLLFLLEQIG